MANDLTQLLPQAALQRLQERRAAGETEETGAPSFASQFRQGLSQQFLTPPLLPGPFGRSFVTGLQQGLLSNVLVGGASDLVGFDEPRRQQIINQLDQQIESNPFAFAGRAAGQFGPELILGVKIFTAASQLAGQALVRNAPRMAQRLQEGTKLRQSFELAARRTQNRPGNFVPVSGLERGAQALGGAAGIGGLVGVEELFKGSGIEKIAAESMKGFALVLGIEAGLIGAAKFLTPRLKLFGGDARELRRQLTPEVRETIKQEIRDLDVRELRTASQIGQLTSARALMQNIDDMVDDARQLNLFPKKGKPRSVSREDVLGPIPEDLSKPLPSGGFPGFRFGGQQRALFGPGTDTPRIRARRGPEIPGLGRKPAIRIPTGSTALRKIEDRQAKLLEDMARIKNARRALKVAVDENSLIPAMTYADNQLPQLTDAAIPQTAHFFRRLMQTPEAFMGMLGFSGTQAIRRLMGAQSEIFVHDTLIANNMGRWRGLAAQHLNTSIRKMDRENRFADVVEAAERGGMDAVEQAFGRPMRQLFEEITEFMRVTGEPVVRIGGKPFLTARDFRELQVQSYWPHSIRRDLGTEELAEKMVRGLMSQGKTRRQAEDIASEIIGIKQSGKTFRRDFAKLGATDYNRVVPGSLRDKLRFGFPFEEDPWIALHSHLMGVTRRRFIGENFGLRGEVADSLVRIAQAEGVNSVMLREILDSAMSRKVYNQAMQRFANAATSTQVIAKMPLSFIPNMGQPAFTATMFEVGNTLKAMDRADKLLNPLSRRFRASGPQPGDEVILRVMGMQESVVEAFRNAMMDVPHARLSLLERAARRTIAWPAPFGITERFNRLSAGIAALEFVGTKLAQGFRGNLRGNQLDNARRVFAKMNLDYDAMIRQMKSKGPGWIFEGPEGARRMEEILFLGATNTQFIPTILNRPELWSHPVGRLFFQFGTFALNAGRFMRDQIIREAALGNHKPIATAFAIYPISGEAIESIVQGVKGKRRHTNGAARVLENITAVGAMGLLQNYYYALRFGSQSGSVLGRALGPTVSDAEGIATSLGSLLTRGDLDPTIRFVTRQPAFQAGRALLVLGALPFAGTAAFLEQQQASSLARQIDARNEALRAAQAEEVPE